MVLLDTGTPRTSREIYSEDACGETAGNNGVIEIPRRISTRMVQDNFAF